MNEREYGWRTLAELTRGIDVALLTTTAINGVLRSRPMVTHEIAGGDGLWFVVSAASQIVEELREDARVNVAYAEPSSARFVSVSGMAGTVVDPERARRLWDERMRRWHPQRADEEELVALRVEVQHVEYWDSDAMRLRNLPAFSPASLEASGGAA